MLNLKNAIKCILLVAVVVGLAFFVDERKVLSILSGIRGSYLLGVIAISFLVLLLQSLRFKFLFSSDVLDYVESIKLGLIGFSFNNLLPSNLGSDLYKYTKLHKRHSDKKTLIYKTLFDRGLGLVSTLVLGVIFFLVNSQLEITVSGTTSSVYLPLILLLLIFVVCIVLLYKIKVNEVCLQDLAMAITLSFAFSVAQSLKFFVIGESLGAHISVFQWFGIIAVVQLFALVPISIGGIGVFEAGLVLVVGLLYISPDMGLAIGVVNRLMVFIVSGLGLALWFSEKNVQ